MGAQQNRIDMAFVDISYQRSDGSIRLRRIFAPNAIDPMLIDDSVVEATPGIGTQIEFLGHDGTVIGRTESSQPVSGMELRALHDLAEIRIVGRCVRAVLRERAAA